MACGKVHRQFAGVLGGVTGVEGAADYKIQEEST